jgi:hypothetical protein
MWSVRAKSEDDRHVLIAHAAAVQFVQHRRQQAPGRAGAGDVAGDDDGFLPCCDDLGQRRAGDRLRQRRADQAGFVPKVTGLNPKVTGFNPKVTGFNAPGRGPPWLQEEWRRRQGISVERVGCVAVFEEEHHAVFW